ncbi:MAG TPA: hypothetical protein VK436_03510 [Methanocella sp.]|nr:hypothetical protein [Methanocella sp.]
MKLIMKSSMTGTVEIKRCGFNERPMLIATDQSADVSNDSTIDVLPEIFKPYDGKKVKITIEEL